MVLEIETGVFVTVAIAVVGAWWALGRMLISQFEKRQDERFETLTISLNASKAENGAVLNEVKRVEQDLHKWQLEIASRYQLKDETAKQIASVIEEIRTLGIRIDNVLHLRQQQQGQ